MAVSIYAKTYYENNKPVGESLEVHVGHLMDNLDELKALYKEEIGNLVDGDNKQFWDSLGLCVLFHDCGKLSTHFQNKIRSKIKEELLKHKTKLNGEIPHNYLSPAFLPEELDDLKEDFFKIFFTIAFHHDRNIGFDKEYLKKVIKEDLQQILDTNKDILFWLEMRLKEYGYKLSSKLWESYFNYLEEGKYNRLRYDKLRKDKSYILLKGLFHRLDYSASAHQPVELERIPNPDAKLLSYLKNKSESDGFTFTGLKDFQTKAKDYRDKSVLLTASTGMGKTEFAINWIGTDKAFYTLPLRVSVNAMYERFVKIFSKDKVALVHSDSALYGIEEKAKIDNFAEEHKFNINKAKQFAFPTTITTADQLFISVFKWPGYEMIYATLMYSKVILDEPQSYSPETLAVIVKALEEISGYGGKFCFMSATIHPYVKKHLKEVVNVGPIYHEVDKHCISLVEKSIEELSDQIKGEFNNSKNVLVICNTIKRAQELYQALDIPSKKLLHGGFIKKHRSLKEIEIQEDYKREEQVVWITTQIVEASLDIDYDILFTEIASIDSLLQRMGRIYRSIGRKIAKGAPPNVVIATKEPSDKYKIYDKTVVLLTLEVLSKYNNNILKEKEKLSLMDKVFGDKDRVKDFYKRFKDSYDLLENGFETEDKKQAQKLFRDIASMTVIPKPIYEENEEEINKLVDKLTSKARLDYRERILATQKIDSFTLSIPIYKASTFVELLPKRGIFKADIDYDNELGILVNKKVKEGENII